MSEVKHYGTWYRAFSQMDAKGRYHMMVMLFTELKNSPDADDRAASRMISECPESWEVVGVVPFIEYMKIDGTRVQLDTSWVHAFGDECLLLKKKGAAYAVLVKPGLKFNDSEMSKYEENEKYAPKGRTGGLTS